MTLSVHPGVGLALARGHRGRHQEYAKRECCIQALESAGAGVAPGAELRFPPRSAPLLNDQWVLSIAHSGPWLVAVAGATNVVGRRTCIGVDIEQYKARDFSGIERFLGWSPRSRDAARFYRRWTLAEAIFKATGPNAGRWFETLDWADAEVAAGAIRVDAPGWCWRAWWPELARGTCACLVLGIEQ